MYYVYLGEELIQLFFCQVGEEGLLVAMQGAASYIEPFSILLMVLLLM